ncbi:glycosyl hydrolase family 32 [Actinotalea sp. K2]|uniref:glycosyl hydrolase family 32 n=1 Tax=Actinotalea sp. K2 TaxID=2939438 RepID=UPI00201734FC|nr:glycosyl hydrolase family 32 [Actinotalea sp. K2]MCL3861219.1 glycosyl hydrolase family 32 [Actinotalea sp. K2]
MLTLDSHWTWDFWTAQDGDQYHLFFLKAPKSLGDPERRHENARVGHAVSTDLRSWEVLPDALGPGPAGAWDDLATWTGSVLRADGRWWMFYTGINARERGAHQRIGLAVSDDLSTWTKEEQPVLVLDVTHYEGGVEGWPFVDWRDPWVYWSTAHGEYRMLFTARAPGGAVDERGVIGQARSQDLLIWQALEPAVAPREFAHLEVPQLFEAEGRWYLSYSVYAHAHSASRREMTPAETGTHYFVADAEAGPYVSPGDSFFCGDPVGELYAGRFERDPDGALVFLAFLQASGGETFLGGLSDPMPVRVEPDGRLVLEREPSRLVTVAGSGGSR